MRTRKQLGCMRWRLQSCVFCPWVTHTLSHTHRHTHTHIHGRRAGYVLFSWVYNVAYIPSGTTATGRRPLPEEVYIFFLKCELMLGSKQNKSSTYISNKRYKKLTKTPVISYVSQGVLELLAVAPCPKSNVFWKCELTLGSKQNKSPTHISNKQYKIGTVQNWTKYPIMLHLF